MACYKSLFICLLLLLPCSSYAKKRKPRAPKSSTVSQSSIPASIVPTDSTGQPIRKKRTPDDIFNALNSVLKAMSSDMDEFNFERIHPHLKIVYALYNELRILAWENQDSLSGGFGNASQDSTPGNRTSISIVQNSTKGFIIRDTSKGFADSSLMIIVEANKPATAAAPTLSPIKSTGQPSINNPANLLTNPFITSNMPSFSLSWDDTSFTKYLLKFEIVKDSTLGIVWNVVFEKVDKLKGKTVKVHRYFDAGEFAISAQDLVWLCDEVKKSESDIKNYFYAKEKEKKESKNE